MAKTIKNYLKFTFSGALAASIISITLQLFFLSPPPPPPPSSGAVLESNGKLQEVIKLGEGFLKQPEDVAVDYKLGILYTATRDGCIKRLHKNGTLENWRQIDSDGLLGLTVTSAGDLIVCDAHKGLLKVNEEGVKVLASHLDNGDRISFADDVVESPSDGVLYFSSASTKYGFHDWQLDVVDKKPNGLLLKHDPSSNVTSVVLYDLGFANGVALSAEQDYLVVCESRKYRCLKYWLEGDFKGQTEIFVDNLPGAPDNINLAPDGSFWIALLEIRPRFRYMWWAAKYIIRVFPKSGNWVLGLQKKAMVVNIASDGSVIRGFDDPTGEVMTFVTSALEFEGHLYFGSLQNDFIGKLPLTTSSANTV